MGISGLLPLLKSIHKPCNLKKFAGQVIGVDAYGWLHRGTVSCAIDLALGKPTTKYVEFAMSRVRMLLHFGIKPYLVFDGDYLPSKGGTEKERATRRNESKKLGLELLKLGKTSQAHLELQKAVDVTPEMARLLIEELKNAKIDYVVAPYEADSQLAYLEKKGIVQGVLSEDSDLLVFGVKCLLTKLDQYGECVMINRNDFTACREISLHGWSDTEFRRMTILSGCDYLPGLSGMGLKTAYRMMRKYNKNLDRLIRAVQFDGKHKVPPGYLEAFEQAEKTFLHQWVFCPIAQGLVHLTDLEAGTDVKDMPYIGQHVESLVAVGVSTGDLHPHSKQKINITVPNRIPHVELAGRSIKQAMTNSTHDLKGNKPIDAFFRPRRIPLAELNPNAFTPSPSQQRLYQYTSVAWSASPAPTRAHSISGAPLPSSAPRLSRRAVSDSSTSSSLLHPPKRQRLCSDSTPDVISGIPSDYGPSTSPFFANASVDPSPSVRRSKNRKTSESEFNLWSDDSMEEAMATLPNTAEGFVIPRKKKVAVFVDEAILALSQASTLDQEASQSTISSRTTSLNSQASITTVDSMGSFESQISRGEPLCISSSQISRRFSYELKPHSTPEPVPPKSRKSLPISRLSQPMAPLSHTRGASWARATSSTTSSRAKAVVPWATSQKRKSSAALSVAATQSYEPPPSPAQNDDDVIEDEAFHIMETEGVVPRSDPPETPYSPSRVYKTLQKALPVLLQERSPHRAKGSEDLLVPDSEAEDEGEEKRPMADLSRFAFGGK
ncbi:hypothetical protein M501DRAFT_955347 [Patellaria atrata CBS 101060]|uniref:Exonuclease 1 n=1 Tax=Patellaria atrata CBS 101060 TaxID=1346257 RepID=A0A9P4S9K5_9PEZI|nr:hypothetical protein M501DRAFT_955347 [Patellaria atrata CBS 101060]